MTYSCVQSPQEPTSDDTHISGIVSGANFRANAIRRCFVSRDRNLLVKAFTVYVHRRIADEYYGGAAVTKFPTKYFRIKLCVESLLCE